MITLKEYGPNINIKGYDGRYKIDKLGNVYSNITRRYLKLQLKKSGYMYVQLHLEGNNKWYRVHRLVAEHFINNHNNAPFVNHRDGDKENNHVNNLEWATGTENNNHAIKTGLVRFSYQIIRVTHCSDWDAECIGIDSAARETGVSRSTISRLMKNKKSSKGYQFEKIGEVKLRHYEV